MGEICDKLHKMANSAKRFSFPFNENELPKNGIYILFERNELGHDKDRIVRVGTHTGNDKLILRLKEHFILENKDRSIFRKNIGRAILNKKDKSFLEQWNWDLTSKANRDKYLHLLDKDKLLQIEKEVTRYIQDNFSFSIIEEKSPKKRKLLESKIISTISNCIECKPSNSWLGNFSPIKKIKESGLWQVQSLYKTPLDENELYSTIFIK
jgi:hypothetical protein